MADNIQVNDNILVELDYQNICLIDPNKVVNIDGTVRERQIHHEDLVMYANLEAKMIPRSKLSCWYWIKRCGTNITNRLNKFLATWGYNVI
jgi:hypothetical protein